MSGHLVPTIALPDLIAGTGASELTCMILQADIEVEVALGQ
jgi:hypothetical protein